MIPLRLTMRNFLGYGDPPTVISFEDLPSPVAITGRNGAGKSSVMHAITWALWERAPRPSAELVHWGAEEMEVAFEFQLEHERYRVRRAYSKARARGRATAGMLSFEVVRADGTAAPVGESGIERTQAEIDRRVSDYRLFVTSVYLAQRADERTPDFARSDPADRLETLASILGLGLWEDLARLAKEEAQGIELEGRALAMRLDTLRIELVAVRAAAEGLLALRPELARLEAERRAAAADERAAADALASADATLQLRTDRERERARITARVAEISELLASAQATLAAQQELLRRADDIEAQERELEGLAARVRALDPIRAETERFGREITAIEQSRRESAAARAVELARCRTLAAGVASLRAQSEQHAVQLEEKRRRLEGLRTTAAAGREALVRLPGLNEEIAELDGRTREMALRGQKLGENLRLLQDAPACPTCLQPLTGEHKQQVLATVSDEQEELRGGYRKAREGLDARRRELAALERTRLAVESAEREAAGLAAQAARLEAETQTLSTKLEEAQAAQARASELEQPQAEDPRLGELRARYEALAYDPEEVRQLQARIEALSHIGDSAKRLAAAKVSASSAQTSIDERGREMADERGRLAAVEEALARDGAKGADRAAIEREVERCRRRREGAETAEQDRRQRVTALETRAGQLAPLLEQLRHAETSRDGLERRKAEAQELVKACGKKGVPWLIIRSVLPELDIEANEMLGLVSDGELTLAFRYEDELKSGAVRPTLGIDILKEGNRQDYDLCSAGQAFKVTFALRVALSRLLARRAGTKLQLLFIDEGFGSQDDESRPLLVEAVKSIAPLFAKIVVISHFSEIREAFACRLDIVRGPSGAQVQVTG